MMSSSSRCHSSGGHRLGQGTPPQRPHHHFHVTPHVSHSALREVAVYLSRHTPEGLAEQVRLQVFRAEGGFSSHSGNSKVTIGGGGATLTEL